MATNEGETDNADELAMLLMVGARISLRSTDAKSFLDWIADAGPALAPTLAKRIDPRAGSPSHFFRTLGVAMFNALPHPDSGFVPRKIPMPGRNDPCFCGSGEKYKHCCLTFAGRSPDFSQFNLLQYVLDVLPKRRWDELPKSRVDRLAVADTARQWLEAGQDKHVVALLEPWFKGDALLTGDLELLFDQLMNCYLNLGSERKRTRLIEQVLVRGDKRLRAAALQRQATMLADAGDIDGAWNAFALAQREDPDNPAHASLECVLLLSRGETTRAQERARFWIARLERRRDVDTDGLIEFLRTVRDQPQTALSSFDMAQVPELDDLARLFKMAPAVQALYDLEGAGEDGYLLLPRPELDAVEAEWQEIFPDIKPMLTATQTDSDEMWDEPEVWLDFLGKHPLAWQSFDILDDLILAVDAGGGISSDATLLEPLLDRGCALLEANLRDDVAADVVRTLLWGWMENRPALRILAHRTYRQLDNPEQGETSDAFIRDAQWLLALNPTDNHGVREPLSRAYLRRGWPARTIALTDKFPDDLCGTTLNRILALYCDGRPDDAAKALRTASKRHDIAIKMLLADKPAKPKEGGWGITVGGREEAWLYRQATRDLWERSSAIDWLRKAWKKSAR